jgi:hypothetical protein
MANNASPWFYLRTLLISFCILFSLTYTIKGQKPDLNKKISIRATNASFDDILIEIAEKGQVKFSYSKSQIPVNNKITLKEKNKTVGEILDKACAQAGVQYLLVEDQIVLKLPKNIETKSPPKITIPAYTLSGFIRDTLSNEVLIGASLVIKGLNIGTITNGYGFYSLTLRKGSYILIFSYFGYAIKEIPVNLKANQSLSIVLPPKASILKEVSVLQIETDNNVRTNQLGEIKLNPSTIQGVPSMMGEGDVLKAIFQLPGVKAYADGSTMYSVRGGERDQNYLILDDAPVFNPSHLLGVFSTLVPDVVKSIDLYKGDMPASQGGRLSSLLDIRTKDGNMNHFAANGSIGILTNRLSVEGPIKKESSSYFLSFRKSHFNWFINKQNNPDLNLMFYDLNGKINFKIKEKHRLYLAFYFGKDDYRSKDAGINWQNGLISARWNYIPSNKLFLNSTVYASSYTYKFVTSFKEDTYWHNNISNVGLKEDFTYYPTPQQTMKFGAGINVYGFDPGNLNISNEILSKYLPVVPSSGGAESSIYYSDEFHLSETLSIRGGLRISSWNSNGPSTEYIFNSSGAISDTLVHLKNQKYNKHSNLEPRLNIKYSFAPNHSVKASYSRTTQYIQLVSNSISPFTSFEVWLPCSNRIQPQAADQFTLGYYLRLPKQQLDFSVEGFYKKMYHQIDYFPHANLLLNPLMEGELTFGKARSYGIEFLVKKETGRLNGWMGYTWSRAFRKMDGIMNGQEFPSSYDSPHNFTFYASYQLTRRLNCSLNWIYSTGTWITTPIGFYSFNGYTVPEYGARNNSRLPDYRRMDVSLNFKLNKNEKRFNHFLSLSIYNLSNRINPVYLNFNKTLDDKGNIVVPSNHLANEGLFPTQLYMYGIVPSLTYNFLF